MTSLNWVEVEAFVITCGRLGMEPPRSVERALHLIEVARAHVADPTGPLLGLNDAMIRERVEQISIRDHYNGRVSDRGMRPGLAHVEDQLSDELASAVVPELDKMITGLQPRFDEAARPLGVAAKDFGIESMTNSDEIIDRDDFEQAGAAWKAMRGGWEQLFPLVQLRIQISKTFRCGPTHEDAERAGFLLGGDDTRLNYSVLFASGDGWSMDPDRYHLGGDRRQQLDWLQLAKSGLRMNTVSEVREKLATLPAHASVPSFRIDPWADELDSLRYTYPRE